MSFTILTNPTTLAFAGHRKADDYQGDWWIVARSSGTTLRSNINLQTMLRQLSEGFGGAQVDVIHGSMDANNDLVIVAPIDDVLTVLGAMYEQLNEQGYLDDEDYWNEIGPHVQAHWDDLDMVDRIKMADGRVDPGCVLEEICPVDLFSEIEAEIADQ